MKSRKTDIWTILKVMCQKSRYQENVENFATGEENRYRGLENG